MTSALKLAIVGGGPSAFFVASRLLQLLPSSTYGSGKVQIDIFDRLWAPHGLVRYGVAPDHPEVKNCTNKFDAAAQDPRLRYFGNVDVTTSASGTPPPFAGPVTLPLSSLTSSYTHLLFATGCTVPALHPALPPGPQVTPALRMVHWYTQHPAASGFIPPLDKASHISVIGQGNVALDIARMLLAPVDYLSKYDVPSSVLDVLSSSRVKHVSILGRRGPLQAAFTTKEVRELMNLPNAHMTPLDAAHLSPPEDVKLTRQQSRILDILRKGSVTASTSSPRSFSLDFFRSPTGMNPLPPLEDGTLQANLHLAHTTLNAEGRAMSTSTTSTLSTSLVIPALGHTPEPGSAFFDPSLGHLRNVSNRVIDAHGRVMKNVYASGWAATGAKGVLASTMRDAHAVADVIIADWMSSTLAESEPPVPSTDATSELALEARPENDATAQEIMAGSPTSLDPPQEVQQALKAGQVCTYEDWKKVDAEEVQAGERSGKERERMGAWNDVRKWLGYA